MIGAEGQLWGGRFAVEKEACGQQQDWLAKVSIPVAVLPSIVGVGVAKLLTFSQALSKQCHRGRAAQVAALVLAGCLLVFWFVFGCFALVQHIKIENRSTQELAPLSGDAVGSGF